MAGATHSSTTSGLTVRDYGLMVESGTTESGTSATFINPIDLFLARAYMTSPGELQKKVIGYYSSLGLSPESAKEKASGLERSLGKEHKLWWGSRKRVLKSGSSVQVYGDTIMGNVASKSSGFHKVDLHGTFDDSGKPWHEARCSCENSRYTGTKMQASDIGIYDFHVALLAYYAKRDHLTQKQIMLPFNPENDSIMVETLVRRYEENQKRADISRILLKDASLFTGATLDMLHSGRASFQVIPAENYLSCLEEDTRKIARDMLIAAKRSGFGNIRYVLERKDSPYETVAIKTDRNSLNGTQSLRVVFEDGLPLLMYRRIGKAPADFSSADSSEKSFFDSLYLVDISQDDSTRKKTYSETRPPNPLIYSIPKGLKEAYRARLQKSMSRGEFHRRLIAVEKSSRRPKMEPHQGISILNFYWPK